MEKTLVVFKPDAVARGIVGEILTRFEKAGLKIVAMKMLQPSEQHYYDHYETIGALKTRKGDEIFKLTLDAMLEGPVIAAVLEGVEAAEVVRKMVGSTEPKGSAPGTIRADYAHMSFGHANTVGRAIPNVLHASGDADEAKREIAHWFAESEIFEYPNVHEVFTHGKGR
ncbi:MAG TPA: nucleoside-diphosphate kinase [Candidatus Saccharimonadales bacterium]